MLVIQVNKKTLSVRDEPASDESDFNKSIPVQAIKTIYYRRGMSLFPEAFIRTIHWIDQEGTHHEFLDGLAVEGKISHKNILEIFTFLKEKKKELGLSFEIAPSGTGWLHVSASRGTEI